MPLDADAPTVSAALSAPDRPARDPMRPVLICLGHAGDDETALVEQIEKALLDAGHPIVRCQLTEPLPGDGAGADTVDEESAEQAAEVLADAVAAVTRALSQRSDVDRDHLRALGVGVGAIVAATLPSTYEGIDKICLVASAPPRKAGASGWPAHLGPIAEIGSPTLLATHEGKVMIVHGAADTRAQVESVMAYRTARESAQRHVQSVLIAGADHAFTDPEARAVCLEQIARYFSDAVPK